MLIACTFSPILAEKEVTFIKTLQSHWSDFFLYFICFCFYNIQLTINKLHYYKNSLHYEALGLGQMGLGLGQMAMRVSCVTDIPQVPALASHDKLGFSNITTFW